MSNPIKVTAAFLVILTPEGFWEVTADVTAPIEAERIIQRHEIRIGCSEVAQAMSQQDLALRVSQQLNSQIGLNSQQLGAKIRDARSRTKPNK